MGGPHSAELFPVLIMQRASVDRGCNADLCKGARRLGLFIYFLEGHLNHHHRAAYPSFFFVIFAVTLGFLQGNKSVAQCNKRKLFFLSLLPEHSGTY